MADGVAVEGIRLVKEYLLRAYSNPNDIEARAQMMSAAAMGATAFQKALGGMHALSHPVGALYNTHHGMTNAVFMPYILKANRAAIEEKIARLSSYLGLASGFDGFLAFIMELRAQLKVPETLAAYNVPPDKIDTLVSMAMQDPSAGGNPVEMTKDFTSKVLIEAFGTA
jgi:alcohol dehydrogenase class IV